MGLHQYVIAGHKRTEIVKYFAFAAVALAPFVTTLAQKIAGTQGVIIPIGLSAALYGGLFWLFDKFGWKYVSKFIDVPDLSGRWKVEGETRDEEGAIRFDWLANIDITQTWTEIGIHLQAEQSSSDSDAATLTLGHNGSAVLTYSYNNAPRIGEAELNPHIGFCRLRFDTSRDTADGEYFNARGRYTFGRMKLSKENPHGIRQ